jgi:hypothetical protein
VGAVAEPLLQFRMSHADGLSHGRATYHDYMRVIRACVDAEGAGLPEEIRHEVLFQHYAVNARGLIVCGWTGDAVAFAARAARHVRRAGDLGALAALGWVLVRRSAGRAARLLARPFAPRAREGRAT